METVVQKGWSVSVMTGSDIGGAILSVCRHINNKIYYGSCHGKQFVNSKAAWAFAFLYGYTVQYFRREWCDTCNEVHSFLKRDCPKRYKPFDFGESIS